MPWSHGRQLNGLLYAIGIATLAILAVISLSLTLNIVKLTGGGYESTKNESMMSDLHLALVDAQSGMRGFILSEDPNYLKPYYRGIQEADSLREQLGEAILGGAQDTDSLNALIEQRLQQMHALIELQNSQGSGAARAELTKGSEKKVMDRIRLIVHQKNQALEERVGEARSNITLHTTVFVIVVYVALFLAAGISSAHFYLFRRVIAEQDRTQALLKLQNQDVEIQTREVETFARMSETMHSVKSREEIYQIIQSYGGAILKGNACALYVYNNSRSELKLSASWGTAQDARLPKHFLPEECWGLRRGRPYMGLAVDGDLNCQHHMMDDQHSSICVPITAGGKTFGLLYVYSGKMPLAALCEISQLASKFTGQLSLALVNIELREELQHSAVHDSLTGLLNRSVLDEIFAREFARADRSKYKLSILMLDIDNFKELNDTYGHSFGDHALKQVSVCLGKMARQTDAVCRYGGEEFLVALTDCNSYQALEKAEKILLAIRNLKFIANNSGDRPVVSASIGIATYPDHAREKSELIKAADDALYQAKHAGRDQVCVYAPPAPEPEQIIKLTTALTEKVL